MPIFGVMRDTLEREGGSMRGEEDFFSVASTMPLVALIPSEVTPWFTALRAYSAICISLLSVGLVVSACLLEIAVTYLHQLPTEQRLARLSRTPVREARWIKYLGEKVVNENEYRSAILKMLLTRELKISVQLGRSYMGLK